MNEEIKFALKESSKMLARARKLENTVHEKSALFYSIANSLNAIALLLALDQIEDEL